MPTVHLLAALLAAALPLSALATDAPAPEPPAAPRVLIVLTSHDQLGSTGRKTGYYLGEVSHPYHRLSRAGIEVDLASPAGGKPPMDPHSLDQPDPVNTRFLENSETAVKLENTRKASEIDPSDYRAVLFAGGHGVMWDFPDSEPLQRVAREIYEAGGVVAAVCHGQAGIVNVKLSDDSWLVAGKTVTSFTNEEEELVQLTEAMPFLLEDRLTERGATYRGAPAWSEHVQVSERLVTGQNPASAGAVADAIARLLREAEAPAAPGSSPRAPGNTGQGMTVDMLLWFAKKNGWGEDSARLKAVLRYLPKVDGLSVPDIHRLNELFRYDSTKVRFTRTAVERITGPLPEKDLHSLVKVIPWGEDSDRLKFALSLMPRQPGTDVASLLRGTALLRYDSTKVRFVKSALRFAPTPYSAAQLQSLVKVIPWGDDSDRLAFTRELMRVTDFVGVQELLTFTGLFRYDSTKVKLVRQGSETYVPGPITTPEAMRLVKVIPWGDDSDRKAFAIRLLPKIGNLGPGDLEAMTGLFRYDSTKRSFIDAGMSAIGF